MIVSTVVIVFVLSGIDSVRARSTSANPGTFNSLMHIDRSLDNYANALNEYRMSIGDDEQMRTSSTEYQRQFNIIWGNLKHFYIQLPDDSGKTTSFANFKHITEHFLQKTEPSMSTDQTLSANQISLITTDLSIVQDEIHHMGSEFFFILLSFRDNLVNNINKLYKFLYIFAAALIGAACLLVALLIHSNNRKNILIKEADSARHDLSRTVAELRSGRIEQRSKDTFIASASHDLSQPLHALGLFLGSLKTHIPDSKGRETLHNAIQCSNNLGNLFKSLMDMSRLDAGLVEVKKKHFRLDQLMETLEQEFKVKAQNTAININIQLDDAVVFSDPILLSRIIRNLIENAFVHSDANLISVSCSSSTDHKLLHIEDNGRGISKSEQKRIFGEYYQISNNASAAATGLGLGLSIVNRLAELLETKISLESEIGVSTSFTLRIPQGQSNKATPQVSNALQNSVTALKPGVVVAVVDDEEIICSAMSLMLSNIGIEAITGTSTDALIDNIIESDKLPDLIVADYRLSKGQTGDQAIEQLKRALNIDVPALLVTGDTSPISMAHADSSGFDLLHKPIQPNELSTKIKQMLLDSVQTDRLAESGNRLDGDSSTRVN